MAKSVAASAPKRLPPHMVRWILAGLVVVALVAVTIRVLLAVFAPSAPPGSAWAIHLEYQLDATRRAENISLAPPWDGPAARLYSQQLDLDGLQLIRSKDSGANGRRITMVSRRTGPISFRADFSVHLFSKARPLPPEKSTLAPLDRAHYLAAEPGINPEDAVVASALSRIQRGATGDADLPDRIFAYVRKAVSFNAAHGAQTADGALKKGIGNGLGRARAMVALCRAARIPARMVTGFVLRPQDNPAPHHWVQVYQAKRWRDYDPEFGFKQGLPENYVAFSRGVPMLSTDGARVTEVYYDVTEQDVPASTAGGEGADPLRILDLARLPLSARATLATLLLLPLGALLNALVRTMVGVQTYGTFSPALLALAAVYVNWLTATVIFVVVAVIAFFGRSMLPGLRLTRSPRLTIVFTLVALAMALAISIMAFFGLLTGAQVVLLPIVILTSLVDRIYTVADDKGLRTALVRLMWTALTAVGCFFLLICETLGELLVRYPELHLITIALVLLLAQHRGRALSDYPALRWLGESDKVK